LTRMGHNVADMKLQKRGPMNKSIMKRFYKKIKRALTTTLIVLGVIVYLGLLIAASWKQETPIMILYGTLGLTIFGLLIWGAVFCYKWLRNQWKEAQYEDLVEKGQKIDTLDQLYSSSAPAEIIARAQPISPPKIYAAFTVNKPLPEDKPIEKLVSRYDIAKGKV
jgi:hypothetical protein